MSEIQIKPEELLDFIGEIGKALTKIEEADNIIKNASSYYSTENIEIEKAYMLENLSKYCNKLDAAHRLVYTAREVMIATDQGESARILSAFGAAYGWPNIKEDLKKWTGGEVTEADQILLASLVLPSILIKNTSLSRQPLNVLLTGPLSPAMKEVYKQVFQGPLAATRIAMNKNIQEKPQQQIEWNRKHLHFENGKLVNPMGIDVAQTVKVIDEYGEYSGTYQVYNNGQIAYLEKQRFVKFIPSKRIGGASPLWAEEQSEITDDTPGASNVKGLLEGLIGINLITGEKLSTVDRGISLVSSVGGPLTRIGGKFYKRGSMIYKVNRELGKVERVGVTGTGKVQTGGRELSIDEYLKQLDKAEEMYESFRKSKTDVQSIAKNTGMTEQRIQRIKEHLFFKEHIKENGTGRFESDYQIAQAWDRLQKGTYNKIDIDLLNHELFESKFEGIFKTDYRTAHDKTIQSGRPWYPQEEE